MINYYKILECQTFDSIENIKSNFIRLSKLYHPDLNQNNTEKYKLIVEAYKILSDEESKSEYDRKLLLQLNVENENKVSNILILPNNRIEYPSIIDNTLPDKSVITINKELIQNKINEYDVKISLYPLEIKMGVFVKINYPFKTICPVCNNNGDTTCYRCNGEGFIKYYEDILIKIPSNIKNNEIFYYEIDNKKKPSYFKRGLYIKVSIL